MNISHILLAAAVIPAVFQAQAADDYGWLREGINTSRHQLLMTTLAAAGIPMAVAAQQRPNIIYIMTDQQAGQAMSCASNTEVRTPNIDRLAAHGVRFDNAYCSFPLSGPSRSAMFTGLAPSQSQVRPNGMPLPDSLKDCTLGSLVEAVGYDTGYSGKWHVHTNSLPEPHSFGFERLHGHNDHGLAEDAVGFLRRKHDKPFFLVASFINPHNICQYARNQSFPDCDIDSAVAATPLAQCPNLPANFAVGPYDADVLQFEKQQNFKLYPNAEYTPDDWRRYRNAYYRLIENVDAEIGKIVDEIDRQNLWKNTVIIFTSDHGDGMGAHRWNQKTALYDEVSNIPFIVCLPGGKNAGKVMHQLINNGIDLMPSICDWTGAELPAGRTGRSFRKLAESGSDSYEHQPYVVTETWFEETAGSEGWSVRTPRYKYVLYTAGRNREALYDMENDRGEMRNLAVEEQFRPVILENREILRRWWKDNAAKAKINPLRYLPKN